MIKFKFVEKLLFAAMNPEGIKNVLEEGDIAICGDRADAQKLL
jgi:manganese-dependent inorganic pyrophosphatase